MVNEMVVVNLCGLSGYAVVGVGAGGCRVAQLKSCRTSLAGGVSAGCLGSMSKLQARASALLVKA